MNCYIGYLLRKRKKEIKKRNKKKEIKKRINIK